MAVLALLGAPWVANRVEPRVLGVPFLLAWVIAGVALTVIAMALLYVVDRPHRDTIDD